MCWDGRSRRSDQTGLFVAAFVITLFWCVRGGKILRRRRAREKVACPSAAAAERNFWVGAGCSSPAAHIWEKTRRIFRKEMPGASVQCACAFRYASCEMTFWGKDPYNSSATRKKFQHQLLALYCVSLKWENLRCGADANRFQFFNSNNCLIKESSCLFLDFQ